MSEQISKEIRELIGQFILDMARTEYAMDECVWAAAEKYPKITENFKYKNGNSSSRAPKNASERLEIARHFFENIDALNQLRDKLGKLDIDAWFKQLEEVKDFRNDIVHGSNDLTYTTNNKTFLRLIRYKNVDGGKNAKLDTQIVELQDIRGFIEAIRYARAAFRDATKILTQRA